jgi:hypothetical protein
VILTARLSVVGQARSPAQRGSAGAPVLGRRASGAGGFKARGARRAGRSGGDRSGVRAASWVAGGARLPVIGVGVSGRGVAGRVGVVRGCGVWGAGCGFAEVGVMLADEFLDGLDEVVPHIPAIATWTASGAPTRMPSAYAPARSRQKTCRSCAAWRSATWSSGSGPSASPMSSC